MHMALVLQAEKRDIFGKKLQPLRAQGKLPAVCYGAGSATQSIWIGVKDFVKVWKAAGESTIVELNLDGGTKNVIIQDTAFDPVTDEPLHADFFAVRMDKPITASVPLVFVGESPAVKNSDGVLVKVMHEVEVKALPGDLPHEISVDIGVLASFEEQITAGDLRLPNGVTLLTHAEEIVALVRQQEAEEAPEKTRTIEDIEVVAKGKKEEEKDEDASPAS